MIRQLIRVAILVRESPSSQLVLVSLIHHCAETHAVMGSNFIPCFSFSRLLSCLFPSTSGHQLQLLSPSPSHSSFTLSLGHPIHLFFIKLQRSPRLISCGSWWNREHAGSFPEPGRGREWCQRSEAGGWFGLGWWHREGSSFWERPVIEEFIRMASFSPLESHCVK